MMGILGTSNEQKSKLDVNKLAKSMRAELEFLHPVSEECCIYRVPKRLREINEKAYTPQVVSIGPLHHGKEELKAMEEHKRRYLQDFLQRSEVSLENFVEFIEDNETRLRNCYAEIIELSSEEFVKMMLLDAAFIIMVLLKDYFIDFRNYNDRIYYRPFMIHEVVFDLCLLENQLPFFILEYLLNLSSIVSHRKECSMIKLTHEFLKGGAWGSWVTEDILEKLNSSKVEHFVDFLRICQEPTEQHGPQILRTLTTPSATVLHQAGVKFKFGSGQKLLDITFDKAGTLEIPRFKIGDWTEILLRNLQAFEQCHCLDNYVDDYISMINMLVNSTKDVEILVQNEIMENWLHDTHAVLSLLHNLGKKNLLVLNNFYFSGLVEDLNKYCRRRRHKWKAILTQKYFHNPWAIVSVIAACTLLILTVIQAVCSIIQVA